MASAPASATPAPSTALIVAPAYPGAGLLYSGPLPPSSIPSDVPALLAMCGLSDYWPNFEEEGYDDLAYLLEVDEGGLEEVADDCKIEKKGHRARLFKRLEQLRARRRRRRARSSTERQDSTQHMITNAKRSCPVCSGRPTKALPTRMCAG